MTLCCVKVICEIDNRSLKEADSLKITLICFFVCESRSLKLRVACFKPETSVALS